MVKMKYFKTDLALQLVATHGSSFPCHPEIALLAVLVTFPVIGVVAILWIGVLMLQKFQLQTRLDDSNWWMINYSDITIIREPSV